MKRRKLISPQYYSMLDAKLKVGIPLAKVMRDTGLEDEISRPSLIKLLKHYNTMTDTDNVTIHNSLFPSWLDPSSQEVVQEQPHDWTYVGYFPLGDWMHEDN